jgi:hypothetical protein
MFDSLRRNVLWAQSVVHRFAAVHRDDPRTRVAAAAHGNPPRQEVKK